LPGGQQVTAVVTNFKDSLVNTVNALPGTKTISALIDSKLSGVTNGLSKVDSVFQGINNAATQVTTAAKNVGSTLENLTTGKGLTSLAQVGIPASILAKADALISKFSSGGASSVVMPTVATNTDGTRPDLDKQTKAQLGNPVIPPPNYDKSPTAPKSEEIINNLSILASRSGPTPQPTPQPTNLTSAEISIRKSAQIRNQIEETMNQIATIKAEKDRLDADTGFLAAYNNVRKQNDLSDQLIALQQKRIALYNELNNLA
jgi:hypothetical protein